MDELVRAHKRLSDRIVDMRLKVVPGLAEDLICIRNAFAEIERRIGVLAVIALNNHYRPQAAMHEATWSALSEMSDHARVVYRIGSHGDQCTCQECCLQRLTKG